MHRGAQIRQVLLDLMDQCDRNHGIWPERLSVPPDSGLKLLYTNPGKIAPSRNIQEILGATVVVHEPLEQYAAGVWVGYADGHVEFASNAAAVAECKRQLAMVQATIATHVTIQGIEPEPQSGRKAVGRLTLNILDTDGRPVVGALVGRCGNFGDASAGEQHVAPFDDPKDRPLVSDTDGRVIVPATTLFFTGSTYLDWDAAPLYVLHEGRGLVALLELHLLDFVAPDAGVGGKTREVRLQPACRIICRLTSIGLRETGRALTGVFARAFSPGKLWIPALYSDSSGAELEFLLPPGDYGVRLSASSCDVVYRFIHIDLGQHEYRLQIDLPPRVSPRLLVGYLAPELRKIKGWKNGGPVRLADLRGKVILLDFWGYWCGPCLNSMPDLMKIHDKYKDKGLVIIAVHNDRVESIQEMDQKLNEARSKLWHGRDLPFLVALDGGGQVRFAGTGSFASGATTAAYLVDSFPTTLLIGRDGMIFKEVQLYRDGAEKELEKELDKMLNATESRGQ